LKTNKVPEVALASGTLFREEAGRKGKVMKKGLMISLAALAIGILSEIY
jgi:hypothetical protein